VSAARFHPTGSSATAGSCLVLACPGWPEKEAAKRMFLSVDVAGAEVTESPADGESHAVG